MNFFFKNRAQLIIFPTLILLGIISAIIVNKSGIFSDALDTDLGEVVFKNQQLPIYEYKDYKTKTNVDLQNRRFLMIYIQTTCKGCQIESEMISQSDLSNDANLRIVGVSNETETEIDEFIKKYRINFPILADSNGEFRKEMGINYFPTNFVLNRGIIEKSWVGTPKSISELTAKIDSFQSR